MEFDLQADSRFLKILGPAQDGYFSGLFSSATNKGSTVMRILEVCTGVSFACHLLEDIF